MISIESKPMSLTKVQLLSVIDEKLDMLGKSGMVLREVKLLRIKSVKPLISLNAERSGSWLPPMFRYTKLSTFSQTSQVPIVELNSSTKPLMYLMLSNPDTLVSCVFQESLNSPVILSNFSKEEREGMDVLCIVIFLASFKLGMLMLLHV